MNLYAVILAGGGGTRFWPLSRRATPKQFLRLGSDRSLLQHTVDRVRGVTTLERTLIVAGAGHGPRIREEVPGLPDANLLLEPRALNTAPAIALAMAVIAARDPGAVAVVLPSDHVIARPTVWARLIEIAAAHALRSETLTTLGVVPNRPATGFGYIEQGDLLASEAEAKIFRVRRFVEKPDAVRAAEFVASERFLWNSGMFVWRADTLLRSVRALEPTWGAPLAEITSAEASKNSAALANATLHLYDTARSVSIDYAVLEKAEHVSLIPADIGWDDVGTWRALATVAPDALGGSNTTRKLIAIDAKGNIMHAPGKLVALLGVENLIIVDTPDAILVCSRDRAESVRDVVARLEASKDLDFL